jgi:exopolyphosphatase/guanosine-5'-triphosphate,3'-diphosphate pyrophosphatase
MTEPGTVTLHVGDRDVTIDVGDGPSFLLPVGPTALADGPLGRGDPPPPIDLTNALAFVQDHLDDAIVAHPALAVPTGVLVTGHHAVGLARVEIGADAVPADYVLERSAADEVFRTLAVEPVDDRRFNPGLPIEQVESIIGTCCVILGVMRRLDLASVSVRDDVTARAVDD